MVGGALVRHFMNIRFSYAGLAPGAGRLRRGVGGDRGRADPGAVAVGRVRRASWPPDRRCRSRRCRPSSSLRCVACHSATPTDKLFKVAPNGLMLDTPEQNRGRRAPHPRPRRGGTMPFANRTAHDRRRAPHRGPLGRPGRLGPVAVTPRTARAQFLAAARAYPAIGPLGHQREVVGRVAVQVEDVAAVRHDKQLGAAARPVLIGLAVEGAGLRCRTARRRRCRRSRPP